MLESIRFNQESTYSRFLHYGFVPEKYCLIHNVNFPIFHRRFLKPSPLTNHRSHGHKNIPPFINLITSATDSLSFLIIFSKFYDTTVDYIIVNSEDKNMDSVTGNSRPGGGISS